MISGGGPNFTVTKKERGEPGTEGGAATGGRRGRTAEELAEAKASETTNIVLISISTPIFLNDFYCREFGNA